MESEFIGVALYVYLSIIYQLNTFDWSLIHWRGYPWFTESIVEVSVSRWESQAKGHDEGLCSMRYTLSKCTVHFSVSCFRKNIEHVLFLVPYTQWTQILKYEKSQLNLCNLCSVRRCDYSSKSIILVTWDLNLESLYVQTLC